MRATFGMWNGDTGLLFELTMSVTRTRFSYETVEGSSPWRIVRITEDEEGAIASDGDVLPLAVSQ